ncbi:MAG: hypothetical protein P4L82_11890 [Ancalomicrobiaceae bacterium]|nr:hypothetical protein [Ancalomicrobiaceae bacterium]
MQALLALVSATLAFKTASRRNRDPDTLKPADCPAVFLLEDSETYERYSPSMPPKRVLLVSAVFYNDIGTDQSQSPATAINTALDALDLAFRPMTPSGLFTMNGLVDSVVIEGEVKKAPGDRTGRSVAIVPIRVVLP